MKKKGFIFDLDGVIVDTAKYHFLAWKQLANGLGIDFTETENEQLKGVSRVRSLEKILSWGKKTIPQDEFMRLMAVKNNEYLGYINSMDESELLPRVRETLQFLRSADQGIALGSASKNARHIIDKVNVTSFFDAIVDGNDVTKAKPDPEVFLIAAKNLGIEPKNCIVFEDSVAGIKAANVAGMISIGIGSATILNEAQFNFKDFTEISESFLNDLINK
jgi:beta-phosphoglucomutase